MPKRNKSGFTLIELLVVIAIIGLLTSVILVALGNARSKARDTRRRADLRQVATALALYYHENGSYPVTGPGVWWGSCTGYGSHGKSGSTGWVPSLAPAYIAILPVDPKPIEPNGCYLYQANASDYKVLSYLTVESIIFTNDTMRDPIGRGSTYAVYTIGATSW